MPWFKTDDGFWRHRKVRKLGRDKVTVPALVACAGLWQLAGSWAAENIEHTDGFVPWSVVEDWDPKRVLATRLLAVGLWELAEHDDETGIRFHDWPDYNWTAAQVIAERAAAARRMALVRDPALREALRRRDRDTCRYCGKRVRWNDRRGALGATYDHVDPKGPGTLDNLVIACRGCNSAKGARTPAEAGMHLIEISNEPESEPEAYLDTDLGENFDRSASPYPSPGVPTEHQSRARRTRTRGAEPPNAADAVAAWVEGMQANGTEPTGSMRGQAARAAKELLDAGNDATRVIAAARQAGRKGFATIDREFAAMNGRRLAPVAAEPKHDPTTGRAVDW